MMGVVSLLYRARRWARRGRLAGGVPVALLGVFLLAGCDNGTPPAQAAKKPRVIVTTPITDEVMDAQHFTGRLDAVKTADIRSRVSGNITQIPFKEGDNVKE